jgi:hypothetical protein
MTRGTTSFHPDLSERTFTTSDHRPGSVTGTTGEVYGFCFRLASQGRRTKEIWTPGFHPCTWLSGSVSKACSLSTILDVLYADFRLLDFRVQVKIEP